MFKYYIVSSLFDGYRVAIEVEEERLFEYIYNISSHCDKIDGYVLESIADDIYLRYVIKHNDMIELIGYIEHIKE